LRIPDDPENRLSFNATGSLLGLASAADQATGYVDQFLPHLFSRRCRRALNGADKRPTESPQPELQWEYRGVWLRTHRQGCSAQSGSFLQ